MTEKNDEEIVDILGLAEDILKCMDKRQLVELRKELKKDAEERKHREEELKNYDFSAMIRNGKQI